MEKSILDWILIVFGLITFLPLAFAQTFAVYNPNTDKARKLLIGKGENCRDRTHLKTALAFAWADLLVLLPLLIIGCIAIILSFSWGYLAWIAAGFISIYFSILTWVIEREYVLSAQGKLAYYTY